jgi:hypothetical protein
MPSIDALTMPSEPASSAKVRKTLRQSPLKDQSDERTVEVKSGMKVSGM